jgi:hypothetical protein
LLLAAVVAVLLLRNADPRYKGRTLEQWIHANSQMPDDPEAREAILTITTNSVPMLLHRLAADTRSEERWEAKLPAFLRKNPIINRFLHRQRYRAACSVRAFMLSGTNAACAAPALAQLLSGPNPQAVKLSAIIILSNLGPAALPSMRQAMNSPDAFVRGLAVFGIGQLGTNAALAIPDVAVALSDPDIGVRTTATNVLKGFAPAPLPPH